jgi:hypothetical protein
MRGCFFTVTTILEHKDDDGREDQEVSAEEVPWQAGFCGVLMDSM